MKSIILKAHQVRRALSGEPLQVRTLVKPQLETKWFPDLENFNVPNAGWYAHYEPNDPYSEYWQMINCPFGEIGTQFWVRETWRHIQECDAENDLKFDEKGYAVMRTFYRATEPHAYEFVDEEEQEMRWKPSTQMPQQFSRFAIELVGIRVERVQDISEEDALCEGIERVSQCGMLRMSGFKNYGDGQGFISPRASFCSLWESIHGADSWKQNSWVWVPEFRLVAP